MSIPASGPASPMVGQNLPLRRTEQPHQFRRLLAPPFSVIVFSHFPVDTLVATDIAGRAGRDDTWRRVVPGGEGSQRAITRQQRRRYRRRHFREGERGAEQTSPSNDHFERSRRIIHRRGQNRRTPSSKKREGKQCIRQHDKGGGRAGYLVVVK